MLTTHDQLQEEIDRELCKLMQDIDRLAAELDISLACASEIIYLRTRPRWTPALEAELIEQYRHGSMPKMPLF